MSQRGSQQGQRRDEGGGRDRLGPKGPQGSSGGGGRGGSGGGKGHRGQGEGGRRGGPPRGAGHTGSVIYAEGVPAQIPDTLSKQNHDRLISGFKNLPATAEHPLRPGYGTLGLEITLRANFFPVRLPKTTIYDYGVSISLKKDIKRVQQRLFELVEQAPEFVSYANFIAHDSKERLVSAKELPQPLAIDVPFYDEHEESPQEGATTYTVTITFIRELDPNKLVEYTENHRLKDHTEDEDQAQPQDYDPLPLTSALNLVLQKHASKTGVRVGRSRYFFPPKGSELTRIGGGILAWRGFYTSVRPVFKQLMVNVNVCMTAFYEPGNLADALHFFQFKSHGGMLSLPENFRFGLKVKTKPLRHKKKLFAIHNKNAQDTKFSCPEFGGTISVEEYFLKKYGLILNHAKDLPVVNVGTKKKPIFVPAELCEIYEGLPFPTRRGKVDPKLTKEMIKVACKIPVLNAQAIVEKGFPTLGFSPAQSPLTEFDISIEPEMAVIPGRELPPPQVEYKAGKPTVRNGSWNILDVKFHRGGVVQSWWVMVVRDPKHKKDTFTDPGDANLTSFVNDFAKKMRKSGMSIPDGLPRIVFVGPLKHPNKDPFRTTAIDQIRQAIKENLAQVDNIKPSFILVLLNGHDERIYPGIKRIGDVELGIHTVHMLLPKVVDKDKRSQDQYFSNVALKVNTKMGGINHLLHADDMKWLRQKKTMIIGMDVTHPGPGSREGTPSIVAVVASIDDDFVHYPAGLRIQESREEMIDDLSDMVKERLQLYKKKNSSALPERIIVYRGQFDKVLHEELPLVIDACRKINGKETTEYRPTISVVICGKRHHARFYPTDSALADKNGNTRPGTIVDKGVTVAAEFDFYLQAHAGLQGTVKSTHYSTIYDENDFDADTIQQGTHTMSYLYARATKAVSLVPAAYYADQACERGRYYINDFLSAEDNSTSASSKSSRKEEKEEEKKRVKQAAEKMWGEGLHDSLKESMFYI